MSQIERAIVCLAALLLTVLVLTGCASRSISYDRLNAVTKVLSSHLEEEKQRNGDTDRKLALLQREIELLDKKTEGLLAVVNALNVEDAEKRAMLMETADEISQEVAELRSEIDQEFFQNSSEDSEDSNIR